MPCPAFQPSEPAPQAPVPAPDILAALHVLVVEDDSVQRELICAALRHFGVRDISAVPDARAALADLDTAHCDLLICDLNLPGIDGIEFLRGSAGRDIDAVAPMSAADPGILAAVESALSEGGTCVPGSLRKPFSLEAVRLLLLHFGETRTRARRMAQPAMPLPPPADAAMLQEALRSRAFVPFYQPKLGLTDGSVQGVEVLARWRHGDGKLVPPASFIPAMEQTALIDELAWQLIEQALSDATRWAAPLTIAFNLAPRTLEDAGLPERLVEMARAHGIEPGRITLELTETALTRSPQAVHDCVARLRLRGFRIAIDDFGTGYSTMALLLALPFTELKIDRGFVARLAGSYKARTMLEAMIALGKRLNMEVVAEGVETERELLLLRALGCPTAQGFHLGLPMPQAALLDWLASRQDHTLVKQNHLSSSLPTPQP